jgi:hypothetical protein
MAEIQKLEKQKEDLISSYNKILEDKCVPLSENYQLLQQYLRL